jgi:hypothetical protein
MASRVTRLAVLFACALLVACTANIGSALADAKAKAHSLNNTAEVPQLTAAPACPSDDTCANIPNGSSSGPGTVQVGPTQNLGDNQWVYIDTFGFTPGDVLHINYCTDIAPLPTQPLCVTGQNPLLANEDYIVQTLTDGTQSLSYQVLEVDPSDVPLSGEEPGNATVSGTFDCNAGSLCSVNITDMGLNGEGSPVQTDQNTAVIPVSFAASFSGCGSNAANVLTESEFGLEFVLSQAAQQSCSLPDPSIAFNTAADGLAADTAVAAGAAQVAFTDDPEAAQQQQVLSQGNLKLIPVALSANVVGFKAQDAEDNSLFPLNGLDLTPTMVAGLLTGIYSDPQNTDAYACAKTDCTNLGCSQDKVQGTNTKTCSLFTELNYQEGFEPPQSYDAFVRSDDAGSNGLLFAWLCNAPVAPVTVDVPDTGGSTFTASLTEPESAAALLDVGFGPTGLPLKTCPVTDQYPPEAQGSPVEYQGFNDPNQQEIKINAFVQPGVGGSNPFAGFATMNWSEAHYYGMRIAAIQNAAGQFVLPTQASLDAAVADSKVNADGTLTPNYAATDPTAYPMTSVVYAAVCADPTSTSQATAETEMLTQLLTVTGSGSSTTLPEGFAPLTSGLTTQAQSDIAADIVGGASSNSTGCAPGSGSGSTSSGGSSSGGSSSGGPGPTSSTSSGTSTSPSPVSSGSSTTAKHGAAGGIPQSTTVYIRGKAVQFNGLNGPARGSAAPVTVASNGGGGKSSPLFFIPLSSSASRIFLPLALLLGVLALVLGSFLLYSPSLRAQTLALGRAAQRRAAKGGHALQRASRPLRSLFSDGPTRKW